jgi:hypothetical protein
MQKGNVPMQGTWCSAWEVYSWCTRKFRCAFKIAHTFPGHVWNTRHNKTCWTNVDGISSLSGSLFLQSRNCSMSDLEERMHRGTGMCCCSHRQETESNTDSEGSSLQNMLTAAKPWRTVTDSVTWDPQYKIRDLQ